jgi:hypothetical protein
MKSQFDRKRLKSHFSKDKMTFWNALKDVAASSIERLWKNMLKLVN